MSINSEATTTIPRDSRDWSEAKNKDESIRPSTIKPEGTSKPEAGKENQEQRPGFMEKVSRSLKKFLFFLVREPGVQTEMLYKLKSDPENNGKSEKYLQDLAMQELNKEMVLKSEEEMRENIEKNLPYQLDMIQIAQLKQLQKDDILSKENLSYLGKLENKYSAELKHLNDRKRLRGLDTESLARLEKLTKDFNDAEKGLISIKKSGLEQLENNMDQWLANLSNVRFNPKLETDLDQVEKINNFDRRKDSLLEKISEYKERLKDTAQMAVYLEKYAEQTNKTF